jgi:hypothetical protein
MGLITCPDCKKKVSEKAKFCPNCGYPLEELTTEKVKNEKEKPGCLTWLIFWVIVALTLKFCAGIMEDNNKNKDEIKQTLRDQVYNRSLYTLAPLNVRESPSKESKRLYVLPLGSKVRVLEIKGNWSKITFQNGNKKITGWVYNKYLSKTAPKKEEKFNFSIVLRKGEIPKKIIETKNGNFLIVGMKDVSYFDSDGFILFMNKKGRILLKKRINSGYSGYTEYFNSVMETDSGDFIAVGSSPLPLYTRSLDIWVVKFDKRGNVLWQYCYDKKNGADEGTEIINLDKRSFLIAGYYTVTSDEGVDAAFLRIDENGKLLNEFVYGYISSDEVPKAVVKIDSKSFISAGYWKDYSKKDKRWKVWVARVLMDKTNKVLWSKQLPFSGQATSVVKADNNTFIVIADTRIDNQDKLLVFKMDIQGKILWKKFLSETHKDLEASSIIKCQDNTFLIGANIRDPRTGKWNIRLIKIDKAGNIIWKKTITNRRNAILNSIIETKDGSLVIAATIYLKNDAKGWIFEIKPNK